MAQRLFGSVAGGPTPCWAHWCGAPTGPSGRSRPPASVRPLHQSCGGLGPGTLEETEASVSRRRGWVSGGRGRSALGHPLVGGAPGHCRRAVAASDRSAGVRTRVLRSSRVQFFWHGPELLCYERSQGDLAGDSSSNRSLYRQGPGQWVTRPRRTGIRRSAEWRQGQRRNDGASAHSVQCLAGSAESRRARHGRWQRHPDIGLFTRARAAHSVGSGCLRCRRPKGVLPLLQWTGLCATCPSLATRTPP